jgi:hypothetical protein
MSFRRIPNGIAGDNPPFSLRKAESLLRRLIAALVTGLWIFAIGGLTAPHVTLAAVLWFAGGFVFCLVAGLLFLCWAAGVNSAKRW